MGSGATRERVRARGVLFVIIAGLGAGAACTVLAEEAPVDDSPAVSIVFVGRTFQEAPSPEERTAAVERAESGELLVLEPGGEERVLTDPEERGHPLDVADPSVSWDGERIVFAGFSPTDRAWRIWEVAADGEDLRRVTRSGPATDLSRYGDAAPRLSGYDDLDPCYLPDGRICFVSTRTPGVAPAGRLRATNLHVVNADGTDLHRITSERFGADTPAVDPATGEIVYSRWWLTALPETPPSGGLDPRRPPAYYGPVTNANNFSSIVLRGIADPDFPGVNNWSLATVRPDGSGLSMFTGFAGSRELTMAYRPSFLPNGEALTLFIRESPLLGYPGEHGLRLVERGPSVPQALGGPQTFGGAAVMADPNPARFVRGPRPSFFYASAEPLPDGRLVVTAVSSEEERQTGIHDHDLYVQGMIEEGTPTLALLVGRDDRMELDAVPLVARSRPPVIEDRAPRLEEVHAPRTPEEAVRANGTFRFIAENVHFNAPVDVPVANAPPVGRGLTIEFYMNPQRAGVDDPEPPVLVGSREIGPGGRVEMDLPAGVPLFEVLRRQDGRIALGRDGQAFHVGGMNFGVAGSESRCVGCHAGHSTLDVPEDASWTNVAPSAVVTASSELTQRRRGTFSATVLVDRRTDEISSEWAAAPDDETPSVRLRWRVPVRAREVVVYGAKVGDDPTFGTRTQKVRSFTLRTYHGDRLRQQIPVGRDIVPEGTRVALDDTRVFDILEVRMRPEDTAGEFLGEPVPALAEVEVTGKVEASDFSPTIALVRGDANCDDRVNMSDAIGILEVLFRGTGPFCCEEAADIDVDGRANITDAIHLLRYSYAGGNPPASPFPRCGRLSGETLGCEEERCP